MLARKTLLTFSLLVSLTILSCERPPACKPGLVIDLVGSDKVLYTDSSMSDNWQEGQVTYYAFIRHDDGSFSMRELTYWQAAQISPYTRIACAKKPAPGRAA